MVGFGSDVDGERAAAALVTVRWFVGGTALSEAAAAPSQRSRSDLRRWRMVLGGADET
jgi:hypothetical protein